MGLGQQTSVGIMYVSEEEEIAALRAEKETIRRETDVLKAKLEEAKRQLKRSKSETVDRRMLPRLEGPELSVPTKVALAAEAPLVEMTTATRVFPDTAAPDASVKRGATMLTSAAGPSSKISGERRASNGKLFSLAVRDNNNSNSSNNNISSSNSRGNSSSYSSNNTTSNHDSWWEATYVGALLRPFDPGKGCERDARIGAILGVDLPFDRGKA